MKNTIAFILVICLYSTLLHTQTTGVSLHSISNYNQWGWNSIVMQNDLITAATVPAIGGRVMQYDLGSLPSIFINSSELGKTYTPKNDGINRNFGGYKTWPSPQGLWPGSWPPPPTLDYGTYTFQADSISNDSVSVTVTSPIEQWIAPGIQYERRATIYPGTSRVKMEQTMINTGTSTVNWGMWSITQSIVHHPGQTDYENFWSYFPINPNSVYGASGILTDGSSNAWKGEIAPGVYGVQFFPTSPYGKKVFADSHKGWIAYAVISDTVVFARTFEIFESAQYPDDARITVYVSNTNPSYMEVEVKSPLVDLAPGGGRYTFTENWWAAKVRAPILDVNSVGAIANRLTYKPSTQILSAVYGIFHKGTARAVFLDENRQVLSEGQKYIVSPLAELQIQETVTIPTGAKVVEVQIRNENGEYIGIVDSADVSKLETAVNLRTTVQPLEYNLSHNYPNPFNPSTVINYKLPFRSNVNLKIFDTLGREVTTLVNKVEDAGNKSVQWNADNFSSGVYFYRMQVSQVTGKQTVSFTETKKLVLMK